MHNIAQLQRNALQHRDKYYIHLLSRLCALKQISWSAVVTLDLQHAFSCLRRKVRGEWWLSRHTWWRTCPILHSTVQIFRWQAASPMGCEGQTVSSFLPAAVRLVGFLKMFGCSFKQLHHSYNKSTYWSIECVECCSFIQSSPNYIITTFNIKKNQKMC